MTCHHSPVCLGTWEGPKLVKTVTKTLKGNSSYLVFKDNILKYIVNFTLPVFQ